MLALGSTLAFALLGQVLLHRAVDVPIWEALAGDPFAVGERALHASVVVYLGLAVGLGAFALLQHRRGRAAPSSVLLAAWLASAAIVRLVVPIDDDRSALVGTGTVMLELAGLVVALVLGVAYVRLWVAARATPPVAQRLS
ncbi:MAG: hypothetical protein J7513_16725 [Solirubrobacteraceae bacterium]|nr:hypothetical protein [Solirubrobacteraceae bacterium]